MGPLDSVAKKIEERINSIEEASRNAQNDLEIEIDDLNTLYKEMKEFVDKVASNKLGLKTTSDMYANIINIKKLILDTKEKKHKLNENDVRLLKTMSETIQKINSATSDDGSEITINAENLLLGLTKKIGN